MKSQNLKAALFAAILATAPGLGGCSNAQDLLYTTADDTTVNAAVQEARSTLPLFWAKYDEQAPGYDSFALKVGLDADGGGVEHIWVDDIAREDGRIFGHIANEPVDLGALAVGSRIEVEPLRVSDWQYARDGKLYGHFTTRALSAKASPEQRKQMAEMFAPTPVEPGTP